MDSSPAAKRYLADLVVASLEREIGPSLPPGRQLLIFETACRLIRDLGSEAGFSAEAPLPAELLRGRDIGKLAIAHSVARAHGAADPQIEHDLRELMAAQDALLVAAPSLASAHELSARGSLGTVFDPQNTVPARLERYLKQTPWAGAGTAVSVRRLSSGMSKETYIAEVTGGAAPRARIFIRKDAAFSCMLTTVVDEYPLLRLLRSRGFPVPEVIHLESDRSICGTPFMLVEVVEGSADPAAWGDAAVMRGVAEQLIEFLARLHTTALSAELAAPPAWLDPLHMCRSVAGIRATWDRCRIADPLMEAVVAWLESNEPRSERAQVLVHSDAGYHNLLIRDGKLIAVLDWETCHLGYPEEDLLTIRPFIERSIPWPEVLALYRRHGGHYQEGTSEKFYSVFVLARITLSLFNFQAAMNACDPSLDTKDAYIGTRYTKRVLAEAFRAILA